MTSTDSKITCKPIRIKTADHSLFAILHSHRSAVPGICVIMINSGMQNRAGPQRLYWKFAKRIASENIAVLRIDLAGVGDSESDNFETHFDTHSKYDVNAIVDYVASRWPDTVIVLQGLCAGSRVAFKAAAVNPTISGIVAMSTTIVTAAQSAPQSPLEPEDRLSTYAATQNVKSMLRFFLELKFLRLSWWKSRFPGFRGLGAEAKLHFRSIVRAVFRIDPLKVHNEFLDSVDLYLGSNRKVIFLYGTKDFRPLNEFVDRFPNVPEGRDSGCCLCKVENGTHTFSSIDAQNQVIDYSQAWLEKHFQDSRAAAAASAN